MANDDGKITIRWAKCARYTFRPSIPMIRRRSDKKQNAHTTMKRHQKNKFYFYSILFKRIRTASPRVPWIFKWFIHRAECSRADDAEGGTFHCWSDTLNETLLLKRKDTYDIWMLDGMESIVGIEMFLLLKNTYVAVVRHHEWIAE